MSMAHAFKIEVGQYYLSREGQRAYVSGTNSCRKRLIVEYLQEGGWERYIGTVNHHGCAYDGDATSRRDLLKKAEQPCPLGFEWGPSMLRKVFRESESGETNIHFVPILWRPVEKQVYVYAPGFSDEDNWYTKEDAIKQGWELVK